MSTELPPPIGTSIPVEVMRRWDERAETRYTLTGESPQVGALGVEHPGTAVDPGGVVRDVRILVLPGSDADTLRGRIHDNLVALGALRNPNIGAVEATVVMDQGYGLVLAQHDGKSLEGLLEGGPLPARASAEVALEVAWGLAAAHAAVLPDQIRPTAIPHGQIDVSNVSVSGLAEVVLDDYNVHAARSSGASPADDVYALGLLFVQLVDGEPMPALPADPDAARRAIEDDLANLTGLSDDLRNLVQQMLDFEPSNRPDIRSVARRLRRLIPQQEGLWLSAWAESTIGLPERQRPKLVMPTPALVREDFNSDEAEAPTEALSQPETPVDMTPPLIRAGRKGGADVQMRVAPGFIIGMVVLTVVLGGGFLLNRFWLPYFGDMDMADVPTDEAGSDKEAAAGPASGGGKERGPDDPPPDPSGDTTVTVIQAEANLQVEESEKDRPDRERVDTDKAIDTEREATSPIDDGSGGTRDANSPAVDDAGVAEVVEVGPPPWPRPGGTLGELDLYVEVPLAEKVEVRCTNGLSMSGPSAFRAAIMQTTPTTCVVSASLRGGRVARTSLDLDRTRDLVCRHGFHESLRCADRPTGRPVEPQLPSDADLAEVRVDIRVKIPLARTADVICAEGARESGIDVEWLELTNVAIGTCTVEATMPDGAYTGRFLVDQNAEVMCLRDFSGAPDDAGRRPLRCAAATAL